MRRRSVRRERGKQENRAASVDTLLSSGADGREASELAPAPFRFNATCRPVRICLSSSLLSLTVVPRADAAMFPIFLIAVLQGLDFTAALAVVLLAARSFAMPSRTDFALKLLWLAVFLRPVRSLLASGMTRLHKAGDTGGEPWGSCATISHLADSVCLAGSLVRLDALLGSADASTWSHLGFADMGIVAAFLPFLFAESVAAAMALLEDISMAAMLAALVSYVMLVCVRSIRGGDASGASPWREWEEEEEEEGEEEEEEGGEEEEEEEEEEGADGDYMERFKDRVHDSWDLPETPLRVHAVQRGRCESRWVGFVETLLVALFEECVGLAVGAKLPGLLWAVRTGVAEGMKG